MTLKTEIKFREWLLSIKNKISTYWLKDVMKILEDFHNKHQITAQEILNSSDLIEDKSSYLWSDFLIPLFSIYQAQIQNWLNHSLVKELQNQANYHSLHLNEFNLTNHKMELETLKDIILNNIDYYFSIVDYANLNQLSSVRLDELLAKYLLFLNDTKNPNLNLWIQEDLMWLIQKIFIIFYENLTEIICSNVLAKKWRAKVFSNYLVQKKPSDYKDFDDNDFLKFQTFIIEWFSTITKTALIDSIERKMN